MLRQNPLPVIRLALSQSKKDDELLPIRRVLSMHWATFFISTGRCGTQWLAFHLQHRLANAATVEHEPLTAYAPSDRLQHPTLPDPQIQDTQHHLDRIDRLLGRQDYIECGWPCWRALAYIQQRLRGRVRFVHLTRHPIPVACSWVAYGAYVLPLLSIHPQRVLFTPSEADAIFCQYQTCWESLNAFEKVLYFWAEVNGAALRHHERYPETPWLHLTYEDLFHGGGWERLCAFLELDTQPDAAEVKQTRIDQYSFLATTWWEPKNIWRHPLTMSLAKRLGYEPLDFDEAALQRRYLFGT
jgi:hypothetical protein